MQEEKENLKKTMGQFEKQCELYDEQIKQRDSKIAHFQERLLQINDRDKELERIFDYIFDITRSNMIYQPTDGDKIDKQLADIINNASNNCEAIINKAKMIFVREAEGVYSYCKKKVFMKNEKDRLIIRVGGGYMSLDEFIDTFNPIQHWKPKQ